MIDPKNLDKNIKRIVEWVNTADLVIMEIDKNLKSNISDIENLKKNMSNLKDYSDDIKLLKSLLEKLQLDTDNLHNSLEILKKQQKFNREEIQNFLDSLRNDFVSLNNRLENVENFLAEKRASNDIEVNQNAERSIENSDIKNENNSKRVKKSN